MLFTLGLPSITVKTYPFLTENYISVIIKVKAGQLGFCSFVSSGNSWTRISTSTWSSISLQCCRALNKRVDAHPSTPSPGPVPLTNSLAEDVKPPVLNRTVPESFGARFFRVRV